MRRRHRRRQGYRWWRRHQYRELNLLEIAENREWLR